MNLALTSIERVEVFPVGLPVTRTLQLCSRRGPVFPQKAEMETGGAVDLGDRPGIGVEPDEAALRASALAQ